jgi:segregation and condensation protein B
MSIKAKIEAIIYAAEDPVTLEQIFALIKEEARLELANLRRQPEVAGEPETDEITEQELELSAEPVAEPATIESIEPATNEPGDVPAASEPSQEEAAEVEGAADATVAEQAESAEEQPELHPITDLEVKAFLRATIEELTADCSSPERGIEVRQIAGGFRMATKPEQHDVVRSFAKSLKPPIRLSLQALETLAVIAYKQPITAPEISEVRGVDSGGVLGTLLDRKLITTAGRKQVIGRPILYKTTKEFLLRFGLKDVNELPSMEEFEKLAAESLGADLFTEAQASEQAGQQESTANEEQPAVVAEGEAPEATEAAAPVEPVAEASQVQEAQPEEQSAPEPPQSEGEEEPVEQGAATEEVSANVESASVEQTVSQDEN